MAKKSVRFLKGSMGGNQVVLLDGRQVPEERELEIALAALEPLKVGGHQAGVLYEGGDEGEISVRIITITGKTYISMCGGLTQILGKALEVESFLDGFYLRVDEPETRITLLTDSGPVGLEVEIEEGNVGKTWTEMDSFLRECYEIGVHPVDVAGVKGYKVGEALCVEREDIEEIYPDFDLSRIEEPTLGVLRKVQKDFLNQFFPDSPGKTFAIYDRNPRRNGDVRVIFPHQAVTGHIEPACGTGTTVIGLTMAEKGQLPKTGDVRLVAESGDGVESIGGSEDTTLYLNLENGIVQSARFTHNPVEILSSGTLWP